MQTALVVGHARATIKHPSLDGQKLLVAQPVGLKDKPDGPPLLVLDALGCRKGDYVMLTSDGTAVEEITQHEHCPARWSVAGLIDPAPST